ncbi:MAG: molybdopterin-dependent oxidoreductase [Acidisphaera sp.]|nr:molybdopterin-dependent oxidoreductase [Acidisphaera sp.]
MGSNMAENHPIAFRHVLQAKDHGATIVHADPRFTRTSAMADIYAPVRAGSDIAFLGGVIRYILENDLWFRDYALNYTNIATIIEAGFKDAEADGLFSGWNDKTRSYKVDTWQYEGEEIPSSLSEHLPSTTPERREHAKRLSEAPPPSDLTLQHPNCVYQIMKRHYARYTPEMVERVTGCPRDVFVKVCEAWAKNSGRERTGVVCYAVGWTHHSTGVQMIRAAAIIQSLLGNVGRPGGGIISLRGHSTIQGSTDVPTLYDMLPSYLPQPNAHMPHATLADYLKAETTDTGWWHNLPKYMVSLLKAWYGEAATEANQYGYEWVPKIVGDHSMLPMTVAMRDGLIRGMYVLGQNPVIGGSNADMVQRALAKLEWLVVRDFMESDTASFWRNGRLVQKGELRSEDIGTEIFLLPSSLAGEKPGTYTNTHRLVQWHDKVVEAPGDSRSESWFVYHLARRLKAMHAESTQARDAPIQAITLDYHLEGEYDDPSADDILKEMNGWTVADRKQVADYKALKDDGSTACGVWTYSGVYPSEDHNASRSRVPDAPDGPGTHLGWAFAWPSNRRTLCNRASADPDGKPWSERKKLVWWDAGARKWIGRDVPDFSETTPPDYQPDYTKKPKGMEALDGRSPFIMIADGKAAVFAPSGLKDGPLPTHYEPVDSPVHNPLYAQQDNPVVKKWLRPDNRYHEIGDPRFPHVMTTYRVTEHQSGGGSTRGVPILAELQPEQFCEIPTELAAELDIGNTDWIVVSTLRGEVESKALVTDRLRPFEIDGKRVYQIGMPYHFGWQGFAVGDVANALTAVVADPNSSMHENKAFTCALRKGRVQPGDE